MSEKLKAVEKMIADIQKDKEISRAAAIDYMLIVATGRLKALGRYTDTLPEGKRKKGILTTIGRKKRAPKSPKIAPVLTAAVNEVAKPKPKRKRAKRKPKQQAAAEEQAAAE